MKEGSSKIGAVVWVGEENEVFKVWIMSAVSEEQCSEAQVAALIVVNKLLHAKRQKWCKLKLLVTVKEMPGVQSYKEFSK